MTEHRSPYLVSRWRGYLTILLIAVFALVATLAPLGGEAHEIEEPPGNPLFYGEWYRFNIYKPRVLGETWVDMVTVQVTPAEAVTRRGAQITLRRVFELIKDFGDRLIVAMTVSQPGSEKRNLMVAVLTLSWVKTWDGKLETFEGRRALLLRFRHCHGKGSREFSRWNSR